MVEIKRLSPDDWQLLRSGRMAALRDSPQFFGSTLEREMAFSETAWRERLGTPSFAAVDGDKVVGLIALFPAEQKIGMHQVVSMWVTPLLRGTNIANELIEALIGLAQDEGIATLQLWVTESNFRATRFYERHGFVMSGVSKPLPSDASVTEFEMRLSLR